MITQHSYVLNIQCKKMTLMDNAKILMSFEIGLYPFDIDMTLAFLEFG